MIEEYELRPSAVALDDLAKLLSEDGGVFGLIYHPGKKEPWMAMIEWSTEASDSNMTGAAAYALGQSPAIVIEQVLREAGR